MLISSLASSNSRRLGRKVAMEAVYQFDLADGRGDDVSEGDFHQVQEDDDLELSDDQDDEGDQREGQESEGEEDEEEAEDAGEIGAPSCPELEEILKREKDLYKEKLNLHMNSAKSVGSLVCEFCAWRKFTERRKLINHVDKYHKEPYYTAEAAAPKARMFSQWRLVVALYRQRLFDQVLAKDSMEANLLKTTAELIRKWNPGVSDVEKAVLGRSNGLPVCTVVTKKGPELWLRSQTPGTVRISEKLYYTKDFEQLVVSLALQSKGRLENIKQRLWARWSEDNGSLPLLLPDSKSLRNVLHHVFTCPDGVPQQLLLTLKNQATDRGEWVAVSHDCTFKFLFSLMGQKKIAQSEGGLFAAHNFLGVTGASHDFSAQRAEDADSFEAAVQKLFTQSMRLQVRLLYSDSPDEDFLKSFPNAIGCAEDSLHLVLRCEYCTGGKRTPCTAHVMAIQKKFQAAVENVNVEEARTMVYHGAPGQDLEWDTAPVLVPGEGRALQDYSKQPFASYEEYVSALKGVAHAFPESMKLSNGKGRKSKTMLQILQSGSRFRHYMYLRNNGLFRNIADGENIKTGTTHNEAEARILKYWGECVRKQHQDRLMAMESIYGLHRMLCNSYTSTQKTHMLYKRKGDQEIISILAGRIAVGLLLGGSSGANQVCDAVPDTRSKTRKAQVLVSADSREKQRTSRAQRCIAASQQANLDLASGRRVLKKRLTQKVTLRPGMLKAKGVVKKMKKAKSSAAIQNAIESNLAAVDDID